MPPQKKNSRSRTEAAEPYPTRTASTQNKPPSVDFSHSLGANGTSGYCISASDVPITGTPYTATSIGATEAENRFPVPCSSANGADGSAQRDTSSHVMSVHRSPCARPIPVPSNPNGTTETVPRSPPNPLQVQQASSMTPSVPMSLPLRLAESGSAVPNGGFALQHLLHAHRQFLSRQSSTLRKQATRPQLLLDEWLTKLANTSQSNRTESAPSDDIEWPPRDEIKSFLRSIGSETVVKLPDPNAPSSTVYADTQSMEWPSVPELHYWVKSIPPPNMLNFFFSRLVKKRVPYNDARLMCSPFVPFCSVRNAASTNNTSPGISQSGPSAYVDNSASNPNSSSSRLRSTPWGLTTNDIFNQNTDDLIVNDISNQDMGHGALYPPPDGLKANGISNQNTFNAPSQLTPDKLVDNNVSIPRWASSINHSTITDFLGNVGNGASNQNMLTEPSYSNLLNSFGNASLNQGPGASNQNILTEPSYSNLLDRFDDAFLNQGPDIDPSWYPIMDTNTSRPGSFRHLMSDTSNQQESGDTPEYIPHLISFFGLPTHDDSNGANLETTLQSIENGPSITDQLGTASMQPADLIGPANARHAHQEVDSVEDRRPQPKIRRQRKKEDDVNPRRQLVDKPTLQSQSVEPLELEESLAPALRNQDTSAGSLSSHQTSQALAGVVQDEICQDPSLISHLPFPILSPLDLPELAAAERRDPVNYKVLKAYGSEADILTYPHTFQASLHRFIHTHRVHNLHSKSFQILFVYGSLMMSCLKHDIFHSAEESPFCLDIVSKCMVPAYLNDYQRFKVRGSDEPAALRSYRKTNGGRVNGMIIFGLSSSHFETLDRYLEQGFVRQEVPVQIPLQKGHLATKLVQTYVLPQQGVLKDMVARHNLITDRNDPWTVAGFWKMSRVCREWRERQMN